MLRRPLLAAICLAVVLPLTTPAARAGTLPPFAPDAGGFHSVLAYGQGQTGNAADFAAFEATGTPPSTFTDQAGLYNAVITGQPQSAQDLVRYYKNSGFAVPTDVASTQTPIAGATVIRDKAHHVPHIYAATRSAGMFAAGYATAQDRLFLMDVLRRTAEGSTAELLGPSAVPADSAALGQFDLSPAELTAEVMRLPQDGGPEGAQGLADLQQYVAGINDYIDQTRTDPTKLPAEYPALGTLPRAWTLADTAAEAYLLISQFTVAGDGEQKQADILARLTQRLGAARGAAVYRDLRQLADPLAPTTTTQRFPSDAPGAPNPAANAHVDAASITDRNAVVATQNPGVGGALPQWAQSLATHGLGLPAEASNALLVSGAHSASGHPLAAMGPQVGYYSPEILVEYELHAPGVDVSGMSFPGASPFPLIGHARTFAWTGTTALGDNADTFAETLCNPDGSAPSTSSDHYRYRGQCIAFTHRDQTLQTPLSPTAPTSPPETVTLRTDRSVHGPVFGFATDGGALLALVRSTAVSGHAVRSLIAFEELAENRVHSPQDFVAVMRNFTGNENWFYVSAAHIGWLASGWFPRHAAGTDLELPITGTGAFDWQGYDPATHAFTRQPDSFNPTSIDPAQGYLTSWNNKGAPGWNASPGTWSFGRVQRVQLLSTPTAAAINAGHTLTLPQVVGISGNAATQDLRAVALLPDLLSVLGPGSDPTQVRLVAALRQWLAGGAHRRDTTGSGFDDNSPAVLVFDAWWRQTVHRIYDPLLGTDIVKLLDTDEDLVLDERAVTTGFFDGWQGQLSSVLRAAEGIAAPDAPRATSCGGGSVTGCRAVLQAAFAAAVSSVQAAQGTNDPGGWRKPVLCPGDATPTCDENRPITAGAIATPAQPFENRGTFHQAVEIVRNLDGGTGQAPASLPGSPPAAAARAVEQSGGSGGGVLAMTGGLPWAPLALVAVLLGLATRRRARRVSGRSQEKTGPA